MDPRFLQKDEVELELEIRGIDHNLPQVVEVLSSYIEDEAASLRPVPLNLHAGFRTIVSECSEIQSKLSSIRITTGDFDELLRCRARYLHLLGRVNRLLSRSGSHALVLRLESAIREGFVVCSNWIENQLGSDSAETVRDKVEEAAQQQAGALLQLLQSDKDASIPPPPLQHSPKNQLAQHSQSTSTEALASAIRADNINTNPPPPAQHSQKNQRSQFSSMEALGTNNPAGEILSNRASTVQRSPTFLNEALGMYNETAQLAPLTNFSTGTDRRRSSFDDRHQEIHLNPEVIISNSNQNDQFSPASNSGNERVQPSSYFHQAVQTEAATNSNPQMYSQVPQHRTAYASSHQQQSSVTRFPVQTERTRNFIPPTIPPYPQPHATYCGTQQHQSLAPHFPFPGSVSYMDDRQGRGGRVQSNSAQGFSMSKWPLRFAGSSQDLPVDEFLFRAETLARLENLQHPALALGLHQLLVGAAASWYWIYIRNEPNASWIQVKQALTFAFQSNISDAAIRRLIMDRLQRPGERFMDFCVAIQGLEVRLARRMSEVELLDTLRRNMLSHLQDRLLFVPINSILGLQQRVRQIEELVQRQAEVQTARRPIGRIHELSVPVSTFAAEHEDLTRQTEFSSGAGSDNNIEVLRNIELTPFNQLPPGFDAEEHSVQTFGDIGWINAIGNTANKEFCCWNCDASGHTYMDCPSRDRKIFCYGCGEKNVVRPHCPKCSIRLLQGNASRNVRSNGLRGVQRAPGHQSFRPPH